MKWNFFPHNSPCVRGIHLSLVRGIVDSPKKGPVMQNFDVFLFSCQLEQAVKHTVELSAIGDHMAPLWWDKGTNRNLLFPEHQNFLFAFCTLQLLWTNLLSRRLCEQCSVVGMRCVLYSQVTLGHQLNTLRPRQNGRHFADDTFKCIFLNGNVRIPIINSLKFVPRVRLTIFHHWFR